MLDKPTAAFQSWFQGITWLAVDFDSQEDFDRHLSRYEGDWDKMINFLYTMYEHKARRSFRGRIQFVIGKMLEMSPGFADALKARGDCPIDAFKELLSRPRGESGR